MEKINIGDAQPLECSECNYKHGYQQSDLMTISYTTRFAPDGKHDGGFYSESVNILNRGITCYCINCGNRLAFKLNPH